MAHLIYRTVNSCVSVSINTDLRASGLLVFTCDPEQLPVVWLMQNDVAAPAGMSLHAAVCISHPKLDLSKGEASQICVSLLILAHGHGHTRRTSAEQSHQRPQIKVSVSFLTAHTYCMHDKYSVSSLPFRMYFFYTRPQLVYSNLKCSVIILLGGFSGEMQNSIEIEIRIPSLIAMCHEDIIFFF